MTEKPLHGAQPGVETTMIQLYIDQSPHAWKVSVCLEELELLCHGGVEPPDVDAASRPF